MSDERPTTTSPRTLRKRLVIAVTGCALIAGYSWVRSSKPREALEPGNRPIPSLRNNTAWSDTSGYQREILSLWSKRELGDWQGKGKVHEPRILLARLQSSHDLAETNAYIRSLSPWGESGSTWLMNRDGDYDFSLTILTSILWLHGDDPSRLEAATLDHLLGVLLTEDGGTVQRKVPGTLGMVDETENHLLMTEGSRYLKNRWLRNHGHSAPLYDNESNGMEEAILAMLGELRTAGLFEFNSQPYIGYTLSALLNLEAFASDPVRNSARALLDQLNWKYALGSYKLRHYPPFRRRYEYADHTSLNIGYQTAYMKAWLSFSPAGIPPSEMSKGEATHSLLGACLPYRPADGVVHTVFEKDEAYFARLGHGRNASPEIYSAGPGFLLSAGGVHRGSASQIVARPITLLLDDDSMDLADVIHLAGPGEDFKDWNNTGVYKNFACAAGPVHVPDHIKELGRLGGWSVHQGGPNILILAYSTHDLGILAVVERTAPKGLLDGVANANPDHATLRHTFRHPDGRTLAYDVLSPPDTWVMVADDQSPMHRHFDTWPLITID